MTYPIINLTKVHSRDEALRIVDGLQGQSYLQFVVEVCPHQGELYVNVSTRRAETTKEELNDALLMVLASMAFARTGAVTP
jgi:hypothetical protein